MKKHKLLEMRLSKYLGTYVTSLSGKAWKELYMMYQRVDAPTTTFLKVTKNLTEET